MFLEIHVLSCAWGEQEDGMSTRPFVYLLSLSLFTSAILLTSCGVPQPGPAPMRWFDSSGNLYIADSGNNVIRKVDAISGVITTVAGWIRRGQRKRRHGLQRWIQWRRRPRNECRALLSSRRGLRRHGQSLHRRRRQ